MKKLIILFMILIIIPLVQAVGTCNLNKNEPYFMGETATLSCSCTSAAEKNKAGFFVWKQQNGTILSSIPTDSGSCQTFFFTDSIIINAAGNYNATASFSGDAEGLTDPLNWDNPEDTPSVNYSVTDTSLLGCEITDITVPNEIILGYDNYNEFRVIDESTKDGINGISCKAIIFDIDGSPLTVTHYGQNPHYFTTGHDGLGYLYSDFSEKRMKPFTSYSYKILCTCHNDTESHCYDDNTGERFGYRSCETTATFTSGDDMRDIDSYPYLRLIFFLIFFAIGLAFYHVSDITTAPEKALVYSSVGSAFLAFISVMIWFGFKIIISGNPYIDGLNNYLAIIIILLSIWVLIYIIIIKPIKLKKKLLEDQEESEDEVGYY